MKSTRLPGKVLLPAAGRPMLFHLLQRLRAVHSLTDIVIATTGDKADQPILDFATENQVQVFRGSEDDVMARVIGAGLAAKADVIVEITGDCPVIDPRIIEQTIQLFLKNEGCDYASNVTTRTYPDGMDTQVFRLDALKKSASMTADILDREHVTLHMRNHPEIFQHVELQASSGLHWPGLGLTLDEEADYKLLRVIIEHFNNSNPLFSCLDIIHFLQENPNLLQLNKDIKRKGDA